MTITSSILEEAPIYPSRSIRSMRKSEIKTKDVLSSRLPKTTGTEPQTSIFLPTYRYLCDSHSPTKREGGGSKAVSSASKANRDGNFYLFYLDFDGDTQRPSSPVSRVRVCRWFR